MASAVFPSSIESGNNIRPKFVNFTAELANTESLGENNKNVSISLHCSANSSFPGYITSPENLAKAELNLERDMKSCGFLEGEGLGITLSEFRKINIPGFIRECGNMDPLSPGGHICMLFFAFQWQIDDILGIQADENHKNNFHFDTETFTLLINRCMENLEGKASQKANYKEEILDPVEAFLHKIHLLVEKIGRDLRSDIPEYMIGGNADGFLQTTRNWFLCFPWWFKHNPKTDKDVSKKTIQSFRRDIVAMKSAIESFAVGQGIFIEQEIRDDPYFKRLFEAHDHYSMTINEVIGFAKDFQNTDYDSCTYLHFQNGRNVTKTLEDAIKFCNQEHNDYWVLSARLRERYSKNQKFLRYLDIMDNGVTGQAGWYTITPRYGFNKYWVDGEAIFEKEDAMNNERFMESYVQMLGTGQTIERELMA